MRVPCLMSLWLTSALAAAPVVIDEFEGDLSAWGGVAETVLVKQGRQALRWEIDQVGQSVGTAKVPADVRRFRSLGLWVHSAKMTGARIELALLAPDETNRYQATFAVDWRGWNRLELPLWALRPVGQPAGLDQIKGLRLTARRLNLPGTVLVFDELSLSEDDARIALGQQRAVVDLDWRSPFQNAALWQVTVEGGTEGGTRTYWSWLELNHRERPATRDVARFERELRVDLTGWDELEVRLCTDRDGFVAVTAQVDGRPVVVLPRSKGTGRFENLRAPINGKRLERITIDLSEPENDLGGPSGKLMTTFFQYVALHRRSAATRAVEPPPQARPEPEPLESAGLPAALYFGRDDLPALRERAGRGVGKLIAERIRQQADRYLDRTYPEPPATYAGGGWLSAVDPVQNFDAGGILPCAFTYLLTGDPRYAQAARRGLIAYCRVEHWTDGDLARYPLGWGGYGNPFQEAESARFVAPAYDWIYNVLSDSERELVRRSLREKALYWLDDNVQYSFPADMNQGAVFGSGYALAALALAGGEPDAKILIDRAGAAMRTVMARYFGDDGWAPEGFGYWTFTMSTAVTALEPLARAAGAPLADWLTEGVKRGALYPQHLRSVALERFGAINFNDAHYGGGPPSSVLLLYARFLGDAGARQLWDQVFGAGNPPADFLSFLWCEPLPEPAAPVLDPAFRFADRGATFLRTGSAYGGTLFALQTSSIRQGHYHNDRNSFILEAYGERLVVDPGQISYADPTHQELKKAWLHNTLTVGTRDQDFPSSPSVVVGRVLTTPALDFVESDASPAYSYLTRAVRRVVYFRPATFVLLDEAAATESVPLSFNLMLPVAPKVEGATVRTSGPRADLTARMVRPAGATVEQSTWPTDSGRGFHVALTTPQPATSHRLTTVLSARPAGAPEPRIEAVTATGGEGVVITEGETAQAVYQRTAGGEMRGDGWVTDAAVVAWSRQGGKTTGALLHDGTALTAGDVELRAAARTWLAAAVRGNTVILAVPGRVAVEATVGLPAGGPARPKVLCRLVGGGVRPLTDEVSLAGGRCTVKLPAEAGDWRLVVINPPAGMDLLDGAAPRLVSCRLDGQEAEPRPVLKVGSALPEVVRLELADESSALDLESLRAIADGRPLVVTVTERSPDGRRAVIECRLPRDLQLPPTDGLPRQRRIVIGVPDRALYPHLAETVLSHQSPVQTPANCVWLSDLKPLQVFSHGGLKLDVDYLGDELSIDGTRFEKGVLIHPESGPEKPYAEVVYDLRPQADKRRFVALIGLEDSATAGSVTFAVELFRDGQWQRVFDSPVMTRQSGLAEVRVELAGAERLRLYCGDGGNGIGSDHAAWGAARLE